MPNGNPGKPRRAWTRKEEQVILLLRMARKLKLSEIADRIGRTPKAVSEKLRELRAILKPHRKYGSITRAVKQLCKPGRTDSDVAMRLDVSRQNVRDIRKRHGIPAGITPSEGSRIANQFRWAYYRSKTDPDYCKV